MRCQHAVCLPQARLQESKIIIKGVGIFTSSKPGCRVAVPTKTGTVPKLVVGSTSGLKQGPVLGFARIEGRINVDEVYGSRVESTQDVKVVGVVDVADHLGIRLWGGRKRRDWRLSRLATARV